MKRFLFGVLVGAAIYHFADEKKRKKAAESIKIAAKDTADAAHSVVEKDAKINLEQPASADATQ